ncbi:MAG: hypothetical protein RKP20_04065 [Candidatus Competibacter sp.]|nr:hypothetical protein [Candidatus Competibacter sp.]
MNPKIVIRSETDADVSAITEVTVAAWIEIHQHDLLADWQLAISGKKPFPIRGLDQ